MEEGEDGGTDVEGRETGGRAVSVGSEGEGGAKTRCGAQIGPVEEPCGQGGTTETDEALCFREHDGDAHQNVLMNGEKLARKGGIV